MFRQLFRSLKFAFNGIWLALRHERNMRIHTQCAVLVVIANFILQVSRTDWLFTLVLIALVWMAEIFNTAIEKLADRVTLEEDALIEEAKDLSAGAVLIVCIISIVCAVIIYLPYL